MTITAAAVVTGGGVWGGKVNGPWKILQSGCRWLENCLRWLCTDDTTTPTLTRRRIRILGVGKWKWFVVVVRRADKVEMKTNWRVAKKVGGCFLQLVPYRSLVEFSRVFRHFVVAAAYLFAFVRWFEPFSCLVSHSPHKYVPSLGLPQNTI